MNKTLLLTILGLVTICRVSLGARDPISNLVDELSASHTWGNGVFPIIHQPKTAKPEEVVAAHFAKTTDPKGKIRDFKIQEIREVKIRGPLPDVYTAVLCRTEFGDRIILMKFISPESGWWTR
ncbi:MAG: hypothetical protein WAN16_00255 [Chthoniobacterales bacterium]|jgi:hypothetical protein